MPTKPYVPLKEYITELLDEPKGVGGFAKTIAKKELGIGGDTKVGKAEAGYEKLKGGIKAIGSGLLSQGLGGGIEATDEYAGAAKDIVKGAAGIAAAPIQGEEGRVKGRHGDASRFGKHKDIPGNKRINVKTANLPPLLSLIYMGLKSVFNQSIPGDIFYTTEQVLVLDVPTPDKKHSYTHFWTERNDSLDWLAEFVTGDKLTEQCDLRMDVTAEEITPGGESRNADKTSTVSQLLTAVPKDTAYIGVWKEMLKDKKIGRLPAETIAFLKSNYIEPPAVAEKPVAAKKEEPKAAPAPAPTKQPAPAPAPKA